MGTGNSAGHEEAIMPAAAVVDPLSNPIWWDRLHRWDERLTPESCFGLCVWWNGQSVLCCRLITHTYTRTYATATPIHHSRSDVRSFTTVRK